MARAQILIDAGISVREAHGIAGTFNAAVTAAGSDQAGATLLTYDNNLITTASEDQGVRLPSFNAGTMWVVNGAAVTVFVYPPTSAKLNNAPVNVPLLLPPQGGAIFKPISTTQYLVVHT